MAALRLIACAIAAGALVEDDTVETSFASQPFTDDHAPSYPKVYQFEAGITVTDNNSTDTLTPRIRFGTSDIVGDNTEIWAGAAVDVVDGDVGMITGSITFQSATRIVFRIRGTDGVDASATLNSTDALRLFTGTAETAYRLDVTGQWSVAHADNQAAAMSFEVWEAV
jgi:hypothetical protein